MCGAPGNSAISQSNISFIENTPSYHITDAEHALKLLQQNKNITVYDVRSDDEYANKAKLSYMNLGHINGAIHANDETITTTASPADKKAPILLYGNQSAYYAAAELVKQGYSKVYALGNFYDFVWAAFNVEANKNGRNYLTDHDGIY